MCSDPKPDVTPQCVSINDQFLQSNVVPPIPNSYIGHFRVEPPIISYLGAVIMENGFNTLMECMSENDALGTDCNQFIEKCNSEIELVNHLVTNICAQTCCLHNQKL